MRAHLGGFGARSLALRRSYKLAVLLLERGDRLSDGGVALLTAGTVPVRSSRLPFAARCLSLL